MFFKNIKKKPKLKILSGYNLRFRSVGTLSEKNIIKYAEKFKFDYEIKKPIFFERHFYWLKIKMIIENLEENKHEYLFWLDADTFFCRYENILDHINKSKHIFVVNQFFKSKNKSNFPNSNYLTWGPNVGVILVRNTTWSLNFFRNVWNKKKYLNHFWPDNAAFLDELGFKSEITNIKDNKPKKSTLSKFQFLPGTWNSMPKKNFDTPAIDDISNFYFNPIIIHLAGIRRKDRLIFIKKYKHLFIK